MSDGWTGVKTISNAHRQNI